MRNRSEKKLNSLLIGGVPITTILILMGITLIGYWPVSTGLFALKNDAINYFLPYRYSIVESLRAGHLPYWSPYVYMGYPINGDMQSGAFNPIVWLLSVFGRYTLATLHAETLIYLFIGSAGFYKLLAEFKCKNSISLAISIAYLFCGFFTDNGQNIAWIANAAFLPFSYLYFYRILVQNNWKNSVKLALAMSMLFVAGYPFFFICTCYLFLLITIIWIVYQWRANSCQIIRVFFKQIFFAIVATALLCAAPLYHFLFMMPHYERGEAISLELALSNSLPPKSLISFLFPWSLTKTKALLQTDMSHLNSYVGVLTIPMIFAGIITLKRKFILPLLLVVFAFMLLSFGKWGLIRSLTFEYLPLMNRFRHPANFRIFTIQILLVLAAFGLRAISKKNEDQSYQKLSSKVTVGLGIIIAILVLIFWPGNFDFIGKLTGDNSRQGMKDMHSSINFKTSLFLSGIIQILFLVGGYFALAKSKISTYLSFLALNVVIIGQLTIFTTFVSKSPVSEIERHFSYEKNFPIPGIKQTIQCDTIRTLGYPPGLKYVFSKKVVIQEDFTNPSYLKPYADFTNDMPMKKLLSQYPVVYLADKVADEGVITNQEGLDFPLFAFIKGAVNDFKPSSPLEKKLISIVRFGPNRFEFDVESDKSTYFCLFQSNYPYWQAEVDEKVEQISTVNHGFMAVPLAGGSHHVVFEVKESKSTACYIISLLSLILCAILLPVRRKKSSTT